MRLGKVTTFDPPPHRGGDAVRITSSALVRAGRIEAPSDRVDGGTARAWFAARAALRRLRGRG
jgi:hypothetical protein